MNYLTTLDRCQGPECPKCGCRDAKILKEPDLGLGVTTWYGSGMARCRNCRATFHFKHEEAEPAVQNTAMVAAAPEPIAETPDPAKTGVPYVRMKCPQCKSPKLRVTSTRGSIRWHRCSACGHKFKSFERAEAEDGGGDGVIG